MPTSKKPSKNSGKQLRAKCLKAIQLLARISAANEFGIARCVSCDREQHYKDMDGGHFVPKGASSYLALMIENVHPQCKYCNAFGMKHGSAAQQYTLWMQDYYGADYVKALLTSKNKIIKLYKADYEEMLQDFNDQITNHRERLGE